MRWGNVSSPLVLHLTEEELNKILSVNFQNTRLLKKLLSKIKQNPVHLSRIAYYISFYLIYCRT
ncbi:hypothetical protein T4B_13919, partial [Trichinella pseudospiralis]